ncbi:MAG: hypothetical protein H6922_00725 [Pseudomonadaceae bacterium]|nr:hypothetical protein [Pseudomonadaceae bacterium]
MSKNGYDEDYYLDHYRLKIAQNLGLCRMIPMSLDEPYRQEVSFGKCRVEIEIPPGSIANYRYILRPLDISLGWAKLSTVLAGGRGVYDRTRLEHFITYSPEPSPYTDWAIDRSYMWPYHWSRPNGIPGVLQGRKERARDGNGNLIVPFDKFGSYGTIPLPRKMEALLARAYGDDNETDRAVLEMKPDESWPESKLGELPYPVAGIERVGRGR